MSYTSRSAVAALLAFTAPIAAAQSRTPTPIRQATLTPAAAGRVPVSLKDASRNDRWLGLGPRDVRWAPDGLSLYFRWNQRPASNDLPEADLWFRADRDGGWVEPLSARDAELVPGEVVVWNASATRAAWTAGNAVYLYQAAATPTTRRLTTLEAAPTRLRFAERDATLHFMVGEALYRYRLDAGELDVVAARVTADPTARTDAATHLVQQQLELSERVRESARLRDLRRRVDRHQSQRPQAIPVLTGSRLDDIQLSPDGRVVTFRVRTAVASRSPTKYIDYADASGYAKVLDARGKVGEPRDRIRLGALTINPDVAAESLSVRWVALPEAGSEPTVPHGPYWSPDGTRAVVQFVGERDKDLWIASVDVGNGQTKVLAHDHDDGWLGGPPIQSNYTGPTLLEWLPDGRVILSRCALVMLKRFGKSTMCPVTSPWEFLVTLRRLKPSEWR